MQTIAPDELAARVALDRGATIDLALVRSDDSLRLIEGGAVAALDGDLLEHRDDLLEPLREPAATTVDGRSYGLAYLWALDVLVSAPSIPTPASLEVLLDPRYTGEVAMPDDVLTLATAALLNGVADPYALTETELQGAGAVLQAQSGAARRAVRRRRRAGPAPARRRAGGARLVLDGRDAGGRGPVGDHDAAARGHDGLVRELAADVAHPASGVRLPLAQPRHRAGGAGRRRARRPRRRRAARPASCRGPAAASAWASRRRR